MAMSHDEVIMRTEEMFTLYETVTAYTKRHNRPSLSDIAVFETMVEQFENLEMNNKMAHCDIYRAWAEYLESGQFFTLEYGWENQEEQVLDFLEEKGIITDYEDCEYCGETLLATHICTQEEEDEDAAV